MPGPFTQLTNPFNPMGPPPNPALYQPSPKNDESQTTSSILSALARQLFTPDTTGGKILNYFSPPNAPGSYGDNPPGMTTTPNVPPPAGTDVGQYLARVAGVPGPLLPGEMRIPRDVLNPPSSPGGGAVPGPSQAPSTAPSPGGGDQNPPPMLRPAPDGGDAIAGGPGGILSSAVNAGQAAQNDPDITQGVIKDLMTMGGDPEQNKWLALAKAGFAMAASKNPSILGAAGEGGLAGLSDYLASRQQTLQNRYTAAQLQQSAQAHAAEIANQQATQKLAGEEFNFKVKSYMAELPYDQALKAAQADYYREHGVYYQGRATGAGGSGAGSYLANAYNTIYQANIKAGMPEGVAAADAMQKTKGFVSQRDRYAQNYLKVSGSGLTDLNTAPPDVLAQAYAYADAQLGGGGAPAPGPAAAAPAAGVMPAGAVGPAPATIPEGKTANGGQYINRGGWMYPVGP